MLKADTLDKDATLTDEAKQKKRDFLLRYSATLSNNLPPLPARHDIDADIRHLE